MGKAYTSGDRADLVICVCGKEIVLDGPGWRSTERNPVIDRVRCDTTENQHHVPANGNAAMPDRGAGDAP